MCWQIFRVHEVLTAAAVQMPGSAVHTATYFYLPSWGNHMLLRDLAQARSGGRGNRSWQPVIAYSPQDFPLLERFITAVTV